MSRARYVEPDCLRAFEDVDSAAMFRREHLQHRQQYPRLIPATPEELAEVDEVVRKLRSGELDRREHDQPTVG